MSNKYVIKLMIECHDAIELDGGNEKSVIAENVAIIAAAGVLKELKPLRQPKIKQSIVEYTETIIIA